MLCFIKVPWGSFYLTQTNEDPETKHFPKDKTMFYLVMLHLAGARTSKRAWTSKRKDGISSCHWDLWKLKWQPGILCNFQGSTVGPKHKRFFVLIVFEDLFDWYRLVSAASPVLMKMMWLSPVEMHFQFYFFDSEEVFFNFFCNVN